MKPNKGKKVVKAWAIINRRTDAITTASVDDGCGYTNARAIYETEPRSWEAGYDEAIVPCTITYLIPKRAK